MDTAAARVARDPVRSGDAGVTYVADPSVEPLRRWLGERPGLPVTLLGAVYVGFGLAHLWRLEAVLTVDWFAVGLYELLGLAVVYGGVRVSRRELPLSESFRVFAASVGFGAIGFVVAAVLIEAEVRRGTPLQFTGFARAFASVTTAAIGVGLSLYYVDLQAERLNLSAQHETVLELNKRLTVLHRVLRHNLRNELTVIRGHTEILSDRDSTPGVEQSLRTVVDHTRRIESLSENAYRLRQVWAEEAVVDLELVELVENCVRESRDAHPTVEITTALPAHAIARAHPRLQLAVAEALENAIVHNDPEGLEVTVSVEPLENDESAVEISVADTGRGVPDFEPEVLDLAEESPLQHATGLGLWLIYWVIEQSGGHLRFEENEPHGAIVRMQLPTPES